MINSNLFGPNNRLFHAFPCLSDPARRFSLGLKVALVGMHLVFVGALFLIDTDLISKTKNEPWYTVIYLSFCIATLVQYFITASSSPGYVIDAMREVNESSMIHNPPIISKHPTSSKNGNFILTIDRNQPRNPVGPNATIWTKLVLDMYPPGTSLRTITCFYCNVEQPPRAKHCHDCGKCVLQFDHHCVWLGACIGQGNHCRFWWYICEETALCIWTGILYITYLKVNISTAGWKSAIIVFLLVALSVCLIFLLLLVLFHWYLILTNQTTYELVRRRRIPYLRGIPERVHPFSKGICRNLYRFCCAKISVRSMEQLPSQLEIEEKLRPYTCCDLVTCRCC